jgi:ferrous iron transport protein B
MTISATVMPAFRLDYGDVLETEIGHLQHVIESKQLTVGISSRWLALKLLEGDANIQELVMEKEGGAALLEQVRQGAARLAQGLGDDVDIVIADRRYSWIHALVGQAVVRPTRSAPLFSDRLDRVVTSKLFGIPIFLFAMWATLKITSDISKPYLGWVNSVISGPITHWALALFAALRLSGSWMQSLVVDGVIAGVGGVLVFIPVLMSLYFMLGILEDSGYMARAAFVMDRLMNALGLHGKSFLPMLIGFGCSVPAFYATRTLENRKDRILTALLIPFMSCGARLPVYMLFAAVFFPRIGGSVVFAMYLLGILTAIGVGVVLKNTVFKGKQDSTFVMEMPPYRIPNLKSIWFHVREHTTGFLRKAGGIIVVVSVLLWVAMAIPVSGAGKFAETRIENSLFAKLSGAAAPLFKPLGFGSWEASGALITGFVAKEVVVSTMAQIYDVSSNDEAVQQTNFLQDLGEIGGGFVGATVNTLKALPLVVGIDLRNAQQAQSQTSLMQAIGGGFEGISGGHGALAALAFMVFVLIYTPCMVAVAAERQEFGVGVMWASIVGQTTMAWLMALTVFQGGLLLGLG